MPRRCEHSWEYVSVRDGIGIERCEVCGKYSYVARDGERVVGSFAVDMSLVDRLVSQATIKNRLAAQTPEERALLRRIMWEV